MLPEAGSDDRVDSSRASRVVAVVVTYNRKELLSECLAAILAQTHSVDLVVVIDNASTDGSQTHVAQQGLLADARVEWHRSPKNVGGAGGFCAGLRLSHRRGADWTWLLDDDCIPAPSALAAMVGCSRFNDTTGFLCSKVIWTDGTAHRMNDPRIAPDWINYVGSGVDIDVLPVESSSFVSCMISRRAVEACGLPFREFFLWFDDTEYTSRVTRAGFPSFLAMRSLVTHKTRANAGFVDRDDFRDIDTTRFRRAFRNYAVLQRHRLRQRSVLRSAIARYRRDRRATWVSEALVYLLAYVEGLFFNPSIEHVNDGD